MKKPVTVTITGAAGNIGYALAFRVASGQMLGTDQPINLNLLEIPAAAAAVQGVVMELNDCAFPPLNKVTAATMPPLHFKDCNFAMLVGARPRGPGMERKDLLLENAKIFSAQGKALDAVASRDVRVLVVGNPANTNSLIAQRNAPSLPPDRFTAMTRLDHNRGLAQLTEKTRPSPLAAVKKVDHLGKSFGDPISRSAPCDGRRQAGAVGGRRKLVQGRLHSDGAAARRGGHQGARHLLGGVRRFCRDRSHSRLGARHRRRAIGSAWRFRRTAATAFPQGVIYSLSGHLQGRPTTVSFKT